MSELFRSVVEGETLGENLRGMYEERKNERVEQLCRYTSLSELLSLFGKGEETNEKLINALNNPDIWQLIEFGGWNITDQERQSIIDMIGENYAVSLNTIGRMGEGLNGKIGGVIKRYRPLLLPPTACGYGVNSAADNYRTSFLLEVKMLGEAVTVGEIPGDQKYVPFQPTYVSTPHLFVEEYTSRSDKNCCVLEAWGRFISSADARTLSELVGKENEVERIRNLSKATKIPEERIMDYFSF